MFLEIDEGFVGHRKTLRLCGIMRDPTAFAYLIRLWTWACRSAPDGSLAGMEPADVEIAAGYAPLDGRLHAAFVTAGFIDVDSAGAPLAIHDWMDHTGGAIKRMDEAAEKKRLYRLHRDRKCAQDCPLCKTEKGRPVDVPRTVPGQSEDSPETGPIPSEDIPTQSSPVQSSQVKSSQVQSSPVQARDPDPEGEFPVAPAPGALVLSPPSRKARAVKAPAEPGIGAEVRVAFDAFIAAYQAARGTRYVPLPGEGPLLTSLVKVLTPDERAELPEAFTAYLADTDAFAAKQGHSLRWFLTGGNGWNKHRGRDPLAGMSQRDRENVASARAWLRSSTGGGE